MFHKSHQLCNLLTFLIAVFLKNLKVRKIDEEFKQNLIYHLVSAKNIYFLGKVRFQS